MQMPKILTVGEYQHLWFLKHGRNPKYALVESELGNMPNTPTKLREKSVVNTTNSMSAADENSAQAQNSPLNEEAYDPNLGEEVDYEEESIGSPPMEEGEMAPATPVSQMDVDVTEASTSRPDIDAYTSSTPERLVTNEMPEYDDEEDKALGNNQRDRAYMRVAQVPSALIPRRGADIPVARQGLPWAVDPEWVRLKAGNGINGEKLRLFDCTSLADDNVVTRERYSDAERDRYFIDLFFEARYYAKRGRVPKYSNDKHEREALVKAWNAFVKARNEDTDRWDDRFIASRERFHAHAPLGKAWQIHRFSCKAQMPRALNAPGVGRATNG